MNTLQLDITGKKLCYQTSVFEKGSRLERKYGVYLIIHQLLFKGNGKNPDGQYGYLVYTIEPPFDFSHTLFPYVKHGGRFRSQSERCNLGSLRHLEEYGVKLY